MQIFLGADHRGYALKNQIASWLTDQQISYIDLGPAEYDAEDDYNDYAKSVAEAVADNPDSFGVLACGSGQGMCMQANRRKGVRAALCHTANEAIETREHNDANIVCVSADNANDQFTDIIDAFISAQPLPDERYARRCRKLDED